MKASNPTPAGVLMPTPVAPPNRDGIVSPLCPNRPVSLEVGEIIKEKDVEDYTYFLELSKVKQALKTGFDRPEGAAKVEEPWFSAECNVILKTGRKTDTGQLRANIAKCFGGQVCSITVRGTPEKGMVRPSDISRSETGWDARPNRADRSHLVGVGELCSCLKEQVLQPLTGLIAISGSTNSSKSLVARGLMVELLQEMKQFQKRRPHIVTLEDPIEKYLFGKADKGNFVKYAAKHWRKRLDYTPRELGDDKDCPNIATGLQDARRQTPSIVYIGELRRDMDWKYVLDFAGSGHLIITTTHAGSLVETLQNIMAAVGANTPAMLGMMADRILAAIHLRKIVAGNCDALIPAIWRRTSSSIAKLVADGFSSVLPENPSSGKPDEQFGSFGRFWFAQKLLAKSAQTRTAKEVMQEACRLDLRGA